MPPCRRIKAAISKSLHDAGSPKPPALLVGLALDAAILALALALASLFSRFGLLILSLVGLLCGGLVVVFGLQVLFY